MQSKMAPTLKPVLLDPLEVLAEVVEPFLSPIVRGLNDLPLEPRHLLEPVIPIPDPGD